MRTKKHQYTGLTLEEAQQCSETYANANNRLKKIEAKMNGEIDKVKSKYLDEITLLTESMDFETDKLHFFANENKEAWAKKSFDLVHTIIGFRTGTPKVIKDKKFTWDAVTELVSKIFPDLIRTKKELDKDVIIAMRDQDGFTELRQECYIDVVQDETFFVQAKEEEILV